MWWSEDNLVSIALYNVVMFEAVIVRRVVRHLLML